MYKVSSDSKHIALSLLASFANCSHWFSALGLWHMFGPGIALNISFHLNNVYWHQKLMIKLMDLANLPFSWTLQFNRISEMSKCFHTQINSISEWPAKKVIMLIMYLFLGLVEDHLGGDVIRILLQLPDSAQPLRHNRHDVHRLPGNIVETKY